MKDRKVGDTERPDRHHQGLFWLPGVQNGGGRGGQEHQAGPKTGRSSALGEKDHGPKAKTKQADDGVSGACKGRLRPSATAPSDVGSYPSWQCPGSAGW